MEKMVGSVTVNGSELEVLTYATAGKLKFRLNSANFSYEFG
ncbi:MAG: hypothetical protein OTI34_16635 [Lewinella sp.]|nr:hypothetical protein [Lewinella sp.]